MSHATTSFREATRPLLRDRHNSVEMEKRELTGPRVGARTDDIENNTYLNDASTIVESMIEGGMISNTYTTMKWRKVVIVPCSSEITDCSLWFC